MSAKQSKGIGLILLGILFCLVEAGPPIGGCWKPYP